MKINKIRIKNFRVFKDKKIDFGASDIVVFDGPNGFGKTTIYDAIELVFTGKIRRYTDLKSKLIDGRQSFSENPLYHENAQGGDIVLTVEFSKDDNVHVLERIVQGNNISNTIDFSVYRLYTKTDFSTEDRTLVENEELVLTNLFGKNYDKNFQFLNYVEQEESLFLLKYPDKTRKNHIGHLFDLKEFENKIKRIEELKKIIDGIKTQAEKDIHNLNEEIKLLQESLSTQITVSEYIRLFEPKDFDWDQENPDIKLINYSGVAGTDGILDKMRTFLTRKDIFKQYQINNGVNYLIENENVVLRFFRFHNFVSRKEEFRTLKARLLALRNLIAQLNGLNNDTLYQAIDLGVAAFIADTHKNEFLKEIESLQNDLRELTGLDKIYSDISTSRNELAIHLDGLKQVGTTSGECLLCGYDWGTINGLLNAISVKSDQIKSINSDKSNKFNENFLSFKSGIVLTLIEAINVHISGITYHDSFVDELLNIEANQFINIQRTFDFLRFDYSKFLSIEQNNDSSSVIDIFKEEIQNLKVDINEQQIEPYFSEYLREFFNNNTEEMDKLTVELIDRKKNYLRNLWTLSQNAVLQQKLNDLNLKNKNFTAAKDLSTGLNGLKSTYKNSLADYQKKIIKDIEIIFHIYSGRIMQSFQGGLGLFIFADKDGIRFQSNPNKTYDAVFSMSSGQLSALIISFTLALHKKYSQNKIVLIDDPVQTMDELNLYGFIDLLRNEFKDNQIIMSTHEDMMSAFMRYKFKNCNLAERRVNLKEVIES